MSESARSDAPIPRVVALKMLIGASALGLGWLFLMPFLPNMPASGLDPSWSYALNVAVSEGLVFGRDVIFTFGPLASVYTHVYSPQTDHLMMAGSAVYGAALCAMLGLSAYPRRHLAWIAVPLLIALNVLRDPFFLAMPLLVLFNASRVCLPDSSPFHLKPTPLLAFLFALGATALGMAPIIKGSFSGVAVPIAGLTALIIARKSILASLGFIAIVIVSLCFWWASCGQPLGELPQFFAAQSPIISGYTGAMSLSNASIGPALYLAAATIMCGLLFFHFRKEHRTVAWVILLGSAWTLFVAWKGGFVRHDGHAFIAGGSLLLVAYIVSCISSTPKATAAAIIALISATTAVGSVTPIDKHFPTTQLNNAISTTVDGIMLRIKRPTELPTRYQQAVEAIRAEDSLPHVSGTVDVYPFELAAIFANGLQWSGRPILQSYSAYTPTLLKTNADHLTSSRAPKHIFFKLNPIDGRLPSFDDSNSWLTLLSEYNIVGYQAPYIHMEKAATPNGTHLLKSEERSAVFKWDQDIPLDELRPTWINIDMQLSVPGRIVETLFKLPEVEIILTLADGTVVRHRYIPEIGRSGFMLSPYLATTADFTDMAAGLSGTRKVKSFRLVSPFSSLWNKLISIRFMPVSIEAQPRAQSMMFSEPSTPPTALLHETGAKTECSIDSVSRFGHRAGEANVGTRPSLRMQGWTKPGSSSDAREFDTWVVAISRSGEKHYFKAPHEKRPDVAELFKRADLTNSGFAITLDTARLADHQAIGLFTASKDSAYRCEHSIQLP